MGRSVRMDREESGGRQADSVRVVAWEEEEEEGHIS